MLQYFIKLRFILSMLCISTRFNSLLSKSILLCYKESYEINCSSDEQYIVIKNAVFGYLPSYQKFNQYQNNGCTIPDSNKNSHLSDCGTSLLKNVSNKCSGIKSCKLEVMYSQYLQKDSLTCPEIANKYQILTLYVNYECVPKDLFHNVGDLVDIHFIGGYITSVGYFAQKSNTLDEYITTADHFRDGKLLPIKTTFRPKTQLEKLTISPIVFQFQILENTLYSYQKNSTFKTTNPCQMGKLYFQDYYAFTPSNTSSENHSVDKSIIICQSSRDMVGETLEPIIAEQINVSSNINFNKSLEMKRGLLIKFTTIFCPHLLIENAQVTYDDKLIYKNAMEVIGFAKIDCKPGYFLYSSSNSTLTNKSTLSVNCDHEMGIWESDLKSVTCINKLPIYTTTLSMSTPIPTSISSFTSSTREQISISTRPSSTSYTPIISTQDSVIPIVMTTTAQSYVNIMTKYIFPCLSVFLLLPCIFGYILCKKRGKLKCISLDCTSFPRIFGKKENLLKIRCQNNYNHHYRDSGCYRQVRDSITPMSGSLALIGFSPNGSCRQSNRTLTTRVDSKPTIGSRDSFPLYNNTSDFEINQMNAGDELPTKIPKQSPMMRMLRSASSLRNHSMSTFRPMSLSKQSFDRGSNISEGRFFSSQVALLKGRKNINSEFIELLPVMWTSDITPSKTIPNNFTDHSQSDIFSKSNQKVYSPTIDTYLEPTIEVSNQLDEEDSSQLSSLNQRKKSEDYMIYDHSRISSNNIDSISPCSIPESSSDFNNNENEENKRFSMISNNYYGLPGVDVKQMCHQPRAAYPVVEKNYNNDNFHTSNESVYESIDDDHTYQSTMERRKMALPLPPNDD